VLSCYNEYISGGGASSFRNFIYPPNGAKLPYLSRKSVGGIQDAAIDLWILSRTQKILGSYRSSFSETASEIRGIPLKIIKSNSPVES
jgi:hypothetical protein